MNQGETREGHRFISPHLDISGFPGGSAQFPACKWGCRFQNDFSH